MDPCPAVEELVEEGFQASPSRWQRNPSAVKLDNVLRRWIARLLPASAKSSAFFVGDPGCSDVVRGAGRQWANAEDRRLRHLSEEARSKKPRPRRYSMWKCDGMWGGPEEKWRRRTGGKKEKRKG